MKKWILTSALLCVVFFAVAQISYPAVGKGLKIKATDESALIKVNFRSQNLFSYDAPAEGDAEMKAMVRRMRLKFGGYLFNPKFEYKLELGFSNRDIGNGKEVSQVNSASRMILDAVFKYHLNDQHALWFGQTKLPGNRERVISSQALQFVDRSNVNSKFNIDRDFGVQYRYKNKISGMPVILAAALSTGEGRNITVINDGGMSYTGRVEFMPLGAFQKKGAYFSSDLKREEKPRLAVGATYNFNQQTNRTGGQLGYFMVDTNAASIYNDITNIHIDMMFKYQGWSVMSEYAIRNIAEDMSGNRFGTTKSDDFDMGSGFNVQAGYLFKNNMEVAGRYTNIELGPNEDNLKNTEEYTLSFSNYIVGHKLKLQSDISLINQEDVRFRFQFEFGI